MGSIDEFSIDESYTLVIPKVGEPVKIIHDDNKTGLNDEWIELRAPKSLDEVASNMNMTVEEYINSFRIRR